MATDRLQRVSEAVVEAVWLAAVVVVPLLFNVSSARSFESDKTFALRFLVILGAGAALLGWVARPPTSREGGWVSRVRRAGTRPLVAPVLLLAGSHAVSALCSPSPVVSWWGYYNRAQGGVAFLGYVVLFLLMVWGLRTSAQLRRLLHAIVVASALVAAYAVAQRLGADPLRWKLGPGNRVSSTLGNPIFLGAYLVMVIPLTFDRLVEGLRLLRADRQRGVGGMLASACGGALLLQVAALWYSGSRGPLMGLVAGACVAGLLAFLRQRAPGGGTPRRHVAAASVAVVLVVAGVVVAGGGVVERTLGRLGQLSDANVKVRVALWQTAVEAIRAVGPNSAADRYGGRVLRLALGYGPENVRVPASRHAVPALVSLHGADIPDRMHNEVYDGLLSVGLVGTVAYLLLVASALYLALRYVGFGCGRHSAVLFAASSVLGIGAGALVPSAAGASFLGGLGVHAGLLAGTLAYAALARWLQPSAGPALGEGPHSRLVLCLVAALVAHVVETSVGIAITPTRTSFFVVLAILSFVLTSHLRDRMPPAAKVDAVVAPGTGHGQLEVWPQAWVGALAVLVLSWVFVVNPWGASNPVVVFGHNWLAVPGDLEHAFPLPVPLTLLALAILLTLAFAGLEAQRPATGRRRARQVFLPVAAVLVGVWLVAAGLTADRWRALAEGSAAADVVRQAEGRVSVFFGGLLAVVAALSASLVRPGPRSSTPPAARRSCEWGAVLLTVAAVAWFSESWAVRPARADVVFRVAGARAAGGDTGAAVPLYARAEDLDRTASVYPMARGVALARLAASNSNSLAGEVVLAEAELALERALAIDPLNPYDHRVTGNLYVQLAETIDDGSRRAEAIRDGVPYFERAVELAPGYPDAYADWGRACLLLGDRAKATELLRRALRADEPRVRAQQDSLLRALGLDR